MHSVVDPTVALNELLALYGGELRGFVRRRVRTREAADDVRQQTMLQAIRGLEGFRGVNLRAWVFSIARRVITDYAREFIPAATVVTDDLAAERTVEERREVRRICDCRERLTHCLACLEQRCGTLEFVAVLLANLHGWDDRDAAARLRMPLPSFKLLLHGARQRVHAHACGTCPLIAQTGLRANCPKGPEFVRKAVVSAKEPGGRPHGLRSGLTGPELEALRRKLISELGLDPAVARRKGHPASSS